MIHRAGYNTVRPDHLKLFLVWSPKYTKLICLWSHFFSSFNVIFCSIYYRKNSDLSRNKMNEILTICFFLQNTVPFLIYNSTPFQVWTKFCLQLPLPKSLKSSCFVATGALNILIPCLFMVPRRAPALTRLRQRLPLPFI